MRHLMLVTLLTLASVFCGCSWTQAFFKVFEDGYSGGGYTSQDKQRDYDQSVQSWGSSGS